MRLLSCSRCDGFVNPLSSTCPHCSAHMQRVLPGLGAVIAAGAALTSCTLPVAAYGLPPCEYTEDADGDGVEAANGFCADADCDDEDATVHPGVVDDTVDGVDQNCDGIDGPACTDDTDCPAGTPVCNVSTSTCEGDGEGGEGEGEG